MKAKKFDSILVANRGEIALRIIEAIHSLNRHAVVVHSHADRDLPFVSRADQAFSLGDGDLDETYLNQEKIIRIAKEAAVDAIHPGYGFLSENAGFAQRCIDSDISFIGPDPEIIRTMGDKSRARAKVQEFGIPVIQGLTGSTDQLIKESSRLTYPLLIKPSAGGGGKGMRIVQEPEKFEEAALEAAREALRYFASGELYVERLLLNPRHIEVQLMADHHGNAVHLFERECSIQRRHQKIIEESPAASLSENQREEICGYALKLAKQIGYSSAGTVEFLMDESGAFYFLEMNTRIQVEHPVTEMLTGIDLVKEQITVAEGASLSFAQQDIQIRGHVIEARLCAEDPSREFAPSPGKISSFQLPVAKSLRIDSGYVEGNVADDRYDTLLAKILATGSGRQEACDTLSDNMKSVHITGVCTNRDYLISLLQSEHFAENRIHTAFIDSSGKTLLEEFRGQQATPGLEKLPFIAAFIGLLGKEKNKSVHNSPWHSAGRWRLVPEITLKDAGRSYSFSYKIDNDGKSIHFLLRGIEKSLSLEKQEDSKYLIRIDNQIIELWATTDGADVLLDLDGRLHKYRRTDIIDERYPPEKQPEEKEKTRLLTAPLNGHILRMNFKEGDRVKKGESLLVIESMKMENKILSPSRSIVKKTHVKKGQQVHNKQLLITLEIYE